MYRIYVHYHMKPGAGEGFLSQVEAMGLRRAVLAEAGCLQYDYFRGVDDPDVVLLAELWESREAQQVHLKQPHMQALPALKEQYILETKLETFDL